MRPRKILVRIGPFLAIALAPALLRLPFWLAGVALNPIWQAASLTLSATPGFAPGLPGFMDLEAGWTTQALGTQAARQWLAGHIPWWDPFSGIGLPLAAEVQSSALFLPYVLLLALPGGYLLLMMALQVTGGAGAYALMRRLGLSRLAATTGALLFELGGSFAWIGAPCGLPIAFLPMFLLGLERARTGRGYRTIALAVAFSLYAGFPETAYLDGLMALAWAVFRFARLPSGARLGFAVRVAIGGTAGLALAAPLLVPFINLLGQGVLGQREGMDMGLVSLPEPGDALYMLPYALGPIAGYSGFDASGTLGALWGRVGGYLGFPLAIAAVLGVAGARRHERGLRYLLGLWILACLARSAAIPGLRHVWDIVPQIAQIQFFRYSGASWMLAACLLAAFALDDLRHGVRKPGAAWGTVLVCAGTTAAAAWAGRWMIGLLLAATPRYADFLWGSVVWGAITALLGAALLGHGRRPALAAALLLVDASLLFAVPFLSGPRRPKLDAGSVAFLQSHLGLQRFYTLGPFQPNYGGMFGTASINHNYLPLPGWWPDWAKAHLDPTADPVLFLGNFPPDRPGAPTHADEFRHNLAAFASLGVGYVVTAGGFGGLTSVQTSQVSGPPTALSLEGAASLRVTVPAGLARPGQVTAIGLSLGTYRGLASGTLAVHACATNCADGMVPLSEAADGEPTNITLQPALSVGPGQGIEVTLTRSPGHEVVVWLWPNPGRSVDAGRTIEGVAPFLVLDYGAGSGLHIVHRSPAMTIYQVPGAAPYFTADAGCDIVPQGREQVTLRCPQPARLVRRELWYPGWRATIGNATVPVQREGDLFQSVAVPEGSSEIRFTYVPPNAGAALLVFGLALAALLPWRRVAGSSAR